MRIATTIFAVAAVAIMAMAPAPAQAKDTQPTDDSNRNERNAIRRGNKLYNERRYAEAEVEYKKALQYNPDSDKATFNLALAYLNQGGTDDPQDQNSPLNQATTLLQNLVRTSNDEGLVSRAYYNLGNVAFNKQNYDESIEMYKNTLRRNPDDDDARDNLRLAQKKKQEQEQQQQDQDQQQDQQGGMSEANAEQVLKAMQDAEKTTQQKVNAAKLQEEQAARRRTGNLW